MPLVREYADAIVFWTKNASPLLPRLSEIDEAGIPYYFQYTVTPYGRDIETHLNKEQCIKNFLELSGVIGKERVLWRYDPILLTEKYSTAFHTEAFTYLCEKFSDASRRCTISFVDPYPHSPFRACTITDMKDLAEKLSAIAENFGMPLVSCAEEIDLRSFGIYPASCIDKNLCEHLCGYVLPFRKDPNQRPICGCAESIDIGGYHTCRNGCLYCYAGRSAIPETHDPCSPLISGVPDNTDQMLLINTIKSSGYQTNLISK